MEESVRNAVTQAGLAVRLAGRLHGVQRHPGGLVADAMHHDREPTAIEVCDHFFQFLRRYGQVPISIRHVERIAAIEECDGVVLGRAVNVDFCAKCIESAGSVPGGQRCYFSSRG